MAHFVLYMIYDDKGKMPQCTSLLLTIEDVLASKLNDVRLETELIFLSNAPGQLYLPPPDPSVSGGSVAHLLAVG